jgi:hypothetical protein
MIDRRPPTNAHKTIGTGAIARANWVRPRWAEKALAQTGT